MTEHAQVATLLCARVCSPLASWPAPLATKESGQQKSSFCFKKRHFDASIEKSCEHNQWWFNTTKTCVVVRWFRKISGADVLECGVSLKTDVANLRTSFAQPQGGSGWTCPVPDTASPGHADRPFLSGSTPNEQNSAISECCPHGTVRHDTNSNMIQHQDGVPKVLSS
jgi:hypothetical protein